MSRTIKRGPPPRRPAPRRRQPVKRVTLAQRLLAKVPVSEETIKKAVTWTILGGAGAAVLAVATYVGVPGMIGTAIAEEAGHAGFRVQQIEVTGLKRMDRMTVYAVALDQQSRAMPLVNLEDVRAKLLRYGWIKDAHVSRRLPDTLLVDIDERSPVAVNGHSIDANYTRGELWQVRSRPAGTLVKLTMASGDVRELRLADYY